VPGVSSELPGNAVGGAEVALDVALGADGCPAPAVGYAWLGRAADVIPEDPLDGSPTQRLDSLTAFQLVVTEGGSPPEALGAAPTGQPSVDPGTWFTLRAMGFSLDVPGGWSIWSTPDESGMRAGPALPGPPYVQVVVHGSGGIRDDDPFPLMLEDLPKGARGYEFRGDGVPFAIKLVGTGTNGAPTEAEQTLFDRIVVSIRFASWSPGEVRKGWGALPEPAGDIGVAVFDAGTFVVVRDGSTAGLTAYGPVTGCGDEAPIVEVVPGGVTWTCFGEVSEVIDPREGRWPQAVVVRAHDATAIALIEA
jgi:hypothetical protein